MRRYYMSPATHLCIGWIAGYVVATLDLPLLAVLTIGFAFGAGTALLDNIYGAITKKDGYLVTALFKQGPHQ